MISLQLSRELKSAGLTWHPEIHDFFVIPDRGMDNRLFVISDVLSNIEYLQGRQVVAFQGASEWALDYLVASEVVWMPTETQLREILESYLIQEPQPSIRPYCRPGWHRCEVIFRGQTLTFEAADVSDVYGSALLYILTS